MKCKHFLTKKLHVKQNSWWEVVWQKVKSVSEKVMLDSSDTPTALHQNCNGINILGFPIIFQCQNLMNLLATQGQHYGSVAVKCKKNYILKCKNFFAQNCQIHRENQSKKILNFYISKCKIQNVRVQQHDKKM